MELRIPPKEKTRPIPRDEDRQRGKMDGSGRIEYHRSAGSGQQAQTGTGRLFHILWLCSAFYAEISFMVNKGENRSFRARVREMVDEGARTRAERGLSDTDEATRRAGQAVVERAGAALAAGTGPESQDATPIGI